MRGKEAHAGRIFEVESFNAVSLCCVGFDRRGIGETRFSFLS